MSDYDSEADEIKHQTKFSISIFDLLKMYMTMHLNIIDRKFQTSFSLVHAFSEEDKVETLK